MKIFVARLGVQYFLVLEDHYALPINKITEIDLHASNKITDNAVMIRVGEVQYLFTYERADSLREFLLKNKSTLSESFVPEKNSSLEIGPSKYLRIEE